jgi:hypothetical protein
MTDEGQHAKRSGTGWPLAEPDTVTVRRSDLRLLLHGFDHPEETALGSRPFERLRDAVASSPANAVIEVAEVERLIRAIADGFARRNTYWTADLADELRSAIDRGWRL